MSDRLSVIAGGASSLPGIIPPQVNEGAGGFKTSGGSSVSITPDERNADSMNVGVPESQANGKSAEDRTAEQGTMEAFADAKPSPKTIPPADAATPASGPPPEAATPVDVVVAASGDSPKATPPAAAGITLTNWDEYGWGDLCQKPQDLDSAEVRKLTKERDSLISEICEPLDPLVVERLSLRSRLSEGDESLMDEPLVDKSLFQELIKINKQIQELNGLERKINELKRRKDSLISEIYKKLDPLLVEKLSLLSRLFKADKFLMGEPSVNKPLFQELIEINRQIWELNETTREGQLLNWTDQVNAIRSGIMVGMADEGCGRIAETYVQLFFSELTGREQEDKVRKIKDILANEGNERTDTQTFTPRVYGNEDFFKQTAAPIRQLIADALENPDLSGDENLFKNIVKFCSMARAVIADVTGSMKKEAFGTPDLGGLGEPFYDTFSPAQVAFAREFAGKGQLGELTSVLGGKLQVGGGIIHSWGNMLLMGGGLFREFHETTKYLRENPNDPKALEDFTKAAKNFIYAWAQSSTCERGQAAMLMMIIDSMAKYAGCQFMRPEVPEMAKTRLAELSEQIPDKQRITSEMCVKLDSAREQMATARLPQLDKQFGRNFPEFHRKKLVSRHAARLQALTQEYPDEKKYRDELDEFRKGPLCGSIDENGLKKLTESIVSELRRFMSQHVACLQALTQEYPDEKKYRDELDELRKDPLYKNIDESKLRNEVERKVEDLRKFNNEKSKIDTNYYKIKVVGGTCKRRIDEKFLKDFYYNPDVPALHAQSFGRFAELYQCTFVPI